MTKNDVLPLARAGFTAQQISALAHMQPVQQMQQMQPDKQKQQEKQKKPLKQEQQEEKKIRLCSSLRSSLRQSRQTGFFPHSSQTPKRRMKCLQASSTRPRTTRNKEVQQWL